nr:GNAT family N-acetyltransferase [uncultured Rhodoferax sp.]
MGEVNYVIGVHASVHGVDAAAWDGLLAAQAQPSPFMRHAYLAAMEESGSATADTGWAPHCITLHAGGVLQAACMVYLKHHSYGEYVFDWAWASAYQQHGVPYYPKAVIAVPFTPVPGARLLARNAQARAALLKAVVSWCENVGASSLHTLFASDDDVQTSDDAGLMLRHTVQFHWQNTTPGYADFDAFLASLAQDKRKKIRQERRKVAEAGVTFRHAQGSAISEADWDFFYRCYERTYLEHGNPPYLNRDFFARMAGTMPENWLLFVAERNGRPIASSLIAIGAYSTGASGLNGTQTTRVAYGRYWGALEPVGCLHFEACYYQPLQWCIANGYQRFEGGAQGEHKMARALLPVKTTSTHWLAHPAFADAVARFLEREGQGIGNYLDDLGQRSPFKRPA